MTPNRERYLDLLAGFIRRNLVPAIELKDIRPVVTVTTVHAVLRKGIFTRPKNVVIIEK